MTASARAQVRDWVDVDIEAADTQEFAPAQVDSGLTARRLKLTHAGAPTLWLLDATDAQLNEAQMKAAARRISAAVSAPHVSRSYAHPYALLAFHSGYVGVDIEAIENCDADFERSICTPVERAAGPARMLGESADERITSLWSSKEALAKALGDALDHDPRRLGSPAFWPGGSAGRWQAMRVEGLADGHVGWLCWAQG